MSSNSGLIHEDAHELLEPFVRTEITHLSLALCVLGFYLVTIGQFSYIIKSRLFMSSALISLCVGIAVGPIGLDWVSPWQWVNFDEEARYNLTFQLTRLVIGIQVMFAGIDLPGAYLRREAWSLFMLLLPIMTIAWFISAGFILLLFKGLTFLEALAISACITPTDPILANTIVKGRYAEKHVPKAVKDIISAESGANDGLGYPFLFLAIFLMQRTSHGRSINESLQHWIVTTWIYQILMSCVIGALIGYIARKSLKFAHTRQLIDHESFLAYGVGLALFTLGVVGVLGSDDVLACFIAGNSLTWRDFYRIEASEEDTFQDVIDSLLDTAIFIYVGAVMPWSEFTSEFISPWRLVVFAICILVFRRLPAMLALYRFIPALDGFSEGLFAGWFGPIGVSAIYYAILARENLPEDRIAVRESVFPIVIFMAMSSTIVHGITIPATKAAPLAIKRTKSTMSYASRRNNLFTRWFRGSDNGSTSNVPDVPTPANVGTPAAGTPAAGSRAVSRRTSFDDSQHTIREGAGANGGLPAPITVGKTEGGEFAASREEAEKDAEKHMAESAGAGASAGGDVGQQEMREAPHPSHGNGHKVEFALPWGA
ncbi:hypothetical protein NBRC10513v2_001651 [Rhodotorula toruloides]